MAVSQLTMKLVVDTNSKRVMFAEAGNECVDFLFRILALPIGSVIRLLATKEMVGSLGNLYDSFENLDVKYIEPKQDKDILLKPKSATCNISSVPLLTNSPPINTNVSAYRLVMPLSVTSNKGLRRTQTGLSHIYMVSDDLVVKPMSVISSIILMKDFSLKDVSGLKEKFVTLGGLG
ncbi:hypothetical protein H5410_033932 [Solanum commersonii]|uniref:Uncharacterized protein n=1 Tax=Solanum commersonii TaxID=4109 RepID=A0A9J5YQ50_SOLCO|nr:hypothetical protein H5410_033932 [Solanum commersonii]